MSVRNGIENRGRERGLSALIPSMSSPPQNTARAGNVLGTGKTMGTSDGKGPELVNNLHVV